MHEERCIDEKTTLLAHKPEVGRIEGLSLLFTVFCIVDLFGVFPVVALPKAVIDCGLYGIPIVVFVFSMQIYAAILLGRCWVIAEEIDETINEKKRYPYTAVAEMTYGSNMGKFVTILLDATVFGGGIPNLLVASQNLQLFGVRMSSNEVNLSFCWWLIIIGILLCPVMWLGSPKDMKTLSILSVVFVTTVTIMTCYCIAVDTVVPDENQTSMYSRPTLQEVLIAYGIIAFQFDIHPMLMTIQVDMKDSSKISNAVVGGFLVTGTMFTVTTVLAACRYGRNVEPNILQGLPASIPLYFIVLLVTFQLCLSSAVGTSALFQHIEDTLRVPRDFNTRRCFVRSSIVAIGVFLGETVPRFDLVMSLIGSTLTGPLMFIFPPLFYNKLSDMRTAKTLKQSKTVARVNNRLKIEKIISIVIVCFGVTVTVISTYYSWSNVIAYAQFTPSCLLNLTSSAFIQNQ